MSGQVSRARRAVAMKLARIDGYAGRAEANPFACPRLARIYAREREEMERRDGCLRMLMKDLQGQGGHCG